MRALAFLLLLPIVFAKSDLILHGSIPWAPNWLRRWLRCGWQKKGDGGRDIQETGANKRRIVDRNAAGSELGVALEIRGAGTAR